MQYVASTIALIILKRIRMKSYSFSITAVVDFGTNCRSISCLLLSFLPVFRKSFSDAYSMLLIELFHNVFALSSSFLSLSSSIVVLFIRRRHFEKTPILKFFVTFHWCRRRLLLLLLPEFSFRRTLRKVLLYFCTVFFS